MKGKAGDLAYFDGYWREPTAADLRAWLRAHPDVAVALLAGDSPGKPRAPRRPAVNPPPGVVWAGAFAGWTGWRWAATVAIQRASDRRATDWIRSVILIGTDSSGREWSIGEAGWSRGSLYHPLEHAHGRKYAGGCTIERRFRSQGEAKAWLERAVLADRPDLVTR